MEEIETIIENLEDELLEQHDESHKKEIHNLRRELLRVRKDIIPLREAIAHFSNTDNDLVEEKTKIFIKDLQDHTIQIMDMLDSFRDILNGLYELYLSEVSYKMNQVMQVLTVVSTIFIPLTFLSGLYGMNFNYMPELNWRYGYFLLLGLMFMITLGLLYYFRKHKWL